MKTNTSLALLLITVGIVVLTSEGIMFKLREHVVEVGSIHVATGKTRIIPLSPIVGVIALIGGFVVLVKGDSRA